ncbi:DUF4139 domain-containing protein [Desulfonatronum thioautotrophicum]|uniref:DUF4139 domain-containing protein n=1 Tax=Desulfonatronum thioautotrophicum TaxID=617001 RepID=UPI0005EAFF3E|nr:DUF4139 domain-containing protein [Desulfonatronum thioautotrophicum]
MKVLITLSLFFCCVLLGRTSWAEETSSVTVTVYNHGQALINEVREVELPSGSGLVEFSGVAETIEAPTLQVRSLTAPEAFVVLDMNYEYDLISVQSLLDRYVGKTLNVVLPDPHDRTSTVLREAVLLANNDRPIFQVDDQIFVGNHDAVYLAEIPAGLRPRPTLVWLVHNDGPPRQHLDVSYLAGGMNWQADYVLKVDRDNERAALSGWVTLDNQSGLAFEQASLKLVAGEVNVVRPEPVRMRRDMVLASPMAAEQMQQEEFFEYHLYSLPRLVDIANRQTKQVSLLQAPEMGLSKKLVARFGGYPNPGQGTIRQGVDVFLTFKNAEAEGLGLPLPRGIVRAYQESRDGSTLFIGEDRIDHTPRDADVELRMGRAFDVNVERTLTAHEQLGRNMVRYTWEIRIRNSKDEPQQLLLEDTLFGDWRITTSSHAYDQLDARRIRFTLDVPPSSEQDQLLLSYTVESRT